MKSEQKPWIPIPGVQRILIVLLLLWSSTVWSAGEGKTILILDASGSMWQQIDDGYKIKIAQDVVGDLLESIPAEQEIGLITYGHRRKGDCGDIELLVEPGPDSRGHIASAVNALDPKGRTPLSASVIQAADVLRIEENEATVILVSDGEETCGLDPCLVGTELEERGINFTAHVIGFDVEETETRKQLQCLAENTGGQFLTADNATELAVALETVSQVIVPPTQLFASAADDDGLQLGEGLLWSLTNLESGEKLLDGVSESQLSLEAEAGRYRIDVVREADQETAFLEVRVQPDQNNNFSLTLKPYLPDASIDAPEEADIGQTIQVTWDGPNERRDYIEVGKPGEKEYINWVYTSNGNPSSLVMPNEPGEYEIRYVLDQGRKVLATRTVVVTDIAVTLDAPEEANLGQTIEVTWDGPDERRDYIEVGKPGEKEYINWVYTKNGNPSRLAMPNEPGEYEIRYVLDQGRKVLATRTVVVNRIAVTLDAQDQAGLGQAVEVTWEGPDENRDYIEVGKPGEKEYINWVYTKNGNPIRLAMPTEPGEYEIRYVLRQGRKVLATRPVTVEAVAVSLDAATTGNIGASIDVTWEGPDAARDYIEIVTADKGRRISLTYTRSGSPLSLKLPGEPGDYEIRYVMNQDRRVLLSRPITVEAVAVQLDVASEAALGSSVDVTWTGPDESRDYIAVVDPKTKRRINFSHTTEGSPLQLQMPPEPGNYEVHYVLGQGRTVLATQPITVNAIDVSIEHPESAPLGSDISVFWVGPDTKTDYIDIVESGKNRRINLTYTRKGSPLTLQMPPKAGTYTIRYVLGQARTVLAEQEIEVTEINVSLSVQPPAEGDNKLSVSWSGPDSSGDYIELVSAGNQKRIERVYTRRGSPLLIDRPSQPGQYELRYVLGQGRTVLAKIPLDAN